MRTDERPCDFHAQDWILVVEALVQYVGPYTDGSGARVERAYELVEAIAREQGLPPSELLLQFDGRFRSPR